MQAERLDIEWALINHGKLRFEKDNRDHFYYTLTIGGRQVARTKLSMGTKFKTIHDPIFSKIARQVYLRPVDLRRAIDCTINWSDYAALLRERFPELADQILDT